MSHVPPVRLAAFARDQLSTTRAEAVRVHLNECASCRTALDRITGAHEAMRLVARAPAPQPSPASEARGEATVRWARLHAPARVRPWLWASLGLAASAAGLIAFVPFKHPVAPSVAPPRLAEPSRALEPTSLEAMITLLGGNVQRTRERRTASLHANDTLRGGDAVVTRSDGRVAAQWGEGSGFLLLGAAELAIDELDRRTQKLLVSRGEVDVKVGPRQPGEVMKVQSNAHIVTVHGTWFTVAAAGERTTVEVMEGVVEVSELDGSASTILRAPARAVFGRGGRVTSGPLTAKEVSRLKAKSEMNLVPWDLRDSTGVFDVSTEPEGQLAVDGVALGPSPLSVRRGLGRHYIEVTRLQYQPMQRWVQVGPEPGELKVALVQLPSDEDPNEPVAVEEMVKQRQRQIRACYERSLKRDPSLNGTVSLRLKVGAVGQVTRASVEPDSTLTDAQVTSCLEHEAAGWRFSTGKNATVVYPFVFRPE